MDECNVIGAVLVVGGGIAGIQASLDLAEMGYKVYLVEKSSAIGGTMPALDKTFPTNDCSMCILSPKLVECGRHLNIKTYTNSEVVGVKGSHGNFTIILKQEPRYIDEEKCTGCGDCAEACPVQANNEFEKNLSDSKAIYKLYAQAYPNAYAIKKKGISPCKAACPAGVNAHGYIALTRAGKFKEAADIIYNDLLLPATLGRICPHPCENECSRSQAEGALSIAAVKRFLAETQLRPELNLSESKDDKVAIIGSGPAGLTCAYELLKQGYKAKIFEKLPVAGGMLAVGIPDYRLPLAILTKEINYLVSHGVKIALNTKFGEDITLEELKEEGYKAVFLATGAHQDSRLKIPGEDLPQVLSGVEFLRRVNLQESTEIGRKAAVIGGGDVAIDAARSALRLGAEEVTIYYRRSRQEMPARAEEIEAAMAEGIKIKYKMAPTRIIDVNGKVTAIEFAAMELGDPDDSGRRRPVQIPGSEIIESIDTIISAVGQKPSIDCLPDSIKTTAWGAIACDELTLETTIPWVFAGGEVRTGSGIAIQAVREGKEAAESIIRYLEGRNLKDGRIITQKVAPKPKITETLPVIPRVNPREVPVEERVNNFAEVVLGITEEEALTEAGRCLDCGPCSECGQCQVVCKAGCIDYSQNVEYLDIEVGAIILTPGFNDFPAEKLGNYGYKSFPNVVTSPQFERILSASGPYGGHLLRPSDGKEPKRIAWIQCVGSRNVKEDNGYCSSVCCMYAIKEAVIAKEHSRQPLETTIFYMDMRCHGKDFEKYYQRAKEQGVKFTRSRIFEVVKGDNGNLLIRYAEQDGCLRTDEFEMVVLSVGLNPPAESIELLKTFDLKANKYGFVQTNDLKSIQTSQKGILAAGVYSGPKDIPETVTEASAAAAEAASYLVRAKNSLIQVKSYPQEVDVVGYKPRIGVFICHCGINIGGIVNIPEVVKYTQELDNVVYVEDNMYTCSQDTQLRIKEKIKEHRLNRVVVASCSPRTHEPLFKETIREAGLNPFLFEMANIRDQCSWVHMNEPLAATSKAKDLILMAVAKARYLTPIQTKTVKVTPSALVIGGGVSGMISALSIAAQGYQVYLIEKTQELGGMANRVVFNQYGNAVEEFVQELKYKVRQNPDISVYLQEEISAIKGYIGNYETTLASGVRLEHGVVVLATGAKEYRPKEYFYGTNQAVKTYLELEETILTKPEVIKSIKNLVLVNCVGSRNKNHSYCSKVCCNQSVQLSLKAKEINPYLNIFVLYRDIRTYGFTEDYYLEARRKGVIFVSYEEDLPPEVTVDNSILQVKIKDTILNRDLIIPADILGLGAATVANPDNERLAKLLKVPINEDGFFLEAHMKLRPVDFSTDGVYLCGLAHGPKPMSEAIIQGKAAAARTCTVLNKKEIMAGGMTAEINSEKCSGCGTCVTVCPAKAVELDEEKHTARVNEALCKGCGACVASCRSHAADLKGFSNSQIMAMLEDLNKVV
ncbi:MAG: 4Fe-4S ferredoxin [Gracilibacter sp. BRH_c7a]|nr:MAG: 4Fe-4S ferredoxin [Gracilibacter sp. BRH_c7a]